MDAHNSSRHGYHYWDETWPHRQNKTPRPKAANSGTRRFRWFGLEWRIQPLYEQAGAPFGAGDEGLLLWVEFGRGSYSN